MSTSTSTKWTLKVAIIINITFVYISATLIEPKIVEAIEYNDQNLDPTTSTIKPRAFTIDYENDTFRMDGAPFRFVAGSIHYFRCPHQYWRDRLRALRASGMNAVTTYVEWSYHEPEYREYNWKGDKDLIKFIKIAAQEDLFVILRPGPYICAERDMGGFPYWLLTRYPQIKLRTSNEDYKAEVEEWYSRLMPKITPYLYGNGGPIIMVQIENEYGSYDACDKRYMSWLKTITHNWVKDAAVLFTTDGTSIRALRCGSVPGAYATVDFGTGQNVSNAWAIMRRASPHGPLVNSEFYPGWLTHWGEKAATVSASSVTKTMKTMLADDANFNFYMFYGGTNFAFTAGANLAPAYIPDITSYDYDAPLTEAGDPTSKYFAIRDVLKDYLPMPDTPVPVVKPKGAYGRVQLDPLCTLFSSEGRKRFGKKTTINDLPMTMEELGQYSGFVLYETILPSKRFDPSILTISDLRDRALIYLNQSLVGVLSRTRNISTIPLILSQGNALQIFVENQGRVNYLLAEDFKGIRGNVYLNTQPLVNWTMTNYPLENIEEALEGIESSALKNGEAIKGVLRDGPVLYKKVFSLKDDEKALDTYIDMTGWGKGFVWVNGNNLGRYWPDEGPQITLYLPGVYLNDGPNNSNTIEILELENAPDEMTIEFIPTAKLGYARSST